MRRSEDLLLVLHDTESGLVLGTAPTLATAQMLALGLTNTQVDSLPVQLPHRSGEWDSYDFDAEDKLFVLSRGWRIAPAPLELRTPATARRRQLMRLRLPYLHAWETYCHAALARVQGYMSEFAHAFILYELAGDAGANFVDEYAGMHGLGRMDARAELLMKVRSRGLVEARNWAQYEQTAQAMARARSRQELDDCMRRGLDRLYDGGRT